MRKIVSRDPQYVRGDTCLFKWTEWQSFSPARMRPCGKPAHYKLGEVWCCAEHYEQSATVQAGYADDDDDELNKLWDVLEDGD